MNKTMRNKKIFLGVPIRNRGWIIKEYIDAIEKQNLDIQMFFLINDSNDNSLEIILDKQITYDIHNFNFNGYVRGEYSIDNLSKLRNQILEKFLESDCDYFLSIDTDIIIPNDSIEALLSHDKDVVSMVIRNSDNKVSHNFFIDGKHIEREIIDGLIPVDMTGAVYLVKRKVIESGVRYKSHKLGEDVPFCDTALKNGFEIFCDTSLKPIHYFKKNLPLIAKTYEIDCESLNEDIKNKITEILLSSKEYIDQSITYLKIEDIQKGIVGINEVVSGLLGIRNYLLHSEKEIYFDKYIKIYDEMITKIKTIIFSLESNNYSYSVYYLENNLKKDINYCIFLFNDFYRLKKVEKNEG